MINTDEILYNSHFLFLDDAKSKKNFFAIISDKISEYYSLKNVNLFSSLFKREKLGSTCVGNGIAIPHISVDSLKEPKCVISVLSKGINFDSSDNANVDLVFLLLLPTSKKIENLQILAKVSRLVRNTELTNKLRGCKKRESAFAIFSKILQNKAA